MAYATLTWVKPAIDDTLKLTRQSLEQFVENPEDTGSLQEAAGWLHEIRGTLTMLEIETATILVHEMEIVTQALLQGKLKNHGTAYDILMRSLIQLPNYLAHLALGYPDIPLALLPLINKLRALLKQKPLASNALFKPDIHLELPPGKPAPKLPDQKFKVFVHKNRANYQKGLMTVLKTKNKLAGIKLMLTTLTHVQQVCGTAPIAKAWWIAEALLEAMAQKGLPINAALANILKQIDGLLKQLVAHGNAGLRIQPPAALLQNMLYYAANAKSQGPRLSTVKKHFNLAYSLPSKSLLQSTLQVFSGPDIELMKIVVNIVKDDFTRVEETLDIFMRADTPDVTELEPLIEIMKNIAYTLHLLDMGGQAKSMLQQTQLIAAIAKGQRDYKMQEMLKIADALLMIDAALDTLANRGSHARQQIQQETGLLETQLKDVMKVVVEEAKLELVEMIPPILRFLEKKEVDEELKDIPARFTKISGLLHVAHRERAVKLVHLCAEYVQKSIIEKNSVPDEIRQKALADSLISLDFYLDTLAGNPMDGNQILDITQRCLKQLQAA
ncbi:hypothetical protein [Candidatus Venteria ishoeyi]|uniref:Scaffold protein FimL second domain-containing protein n=1 Tax=Candidatus Venteria ishoeyi TaxID=1899563 RepID=A0A1H6F7N4_9GAMM|nr:hypothetical protein [Candidatus Venteria ishoeyi]MDM8547614.1 hypothetical protein [Candidatus Venteria ishoeyi]SEH06142.1 Uncharacterised protein [Candidatus Venteria ishoeyi]